jgi:outer membrane protein
VSILNGAVNLDSSSTGLALQAGVDIPMGNGMYFNLDIKKLKLKSDVYVAATGANLGTIKLDPTLVGVGIGWRF